MADSKIDGGADAGAGDAGGSTFNPSNPNNFNVEVSYLLIPGLMVVLFIVYLIYKLLTSYKMKELAKEEKRKKKEERKKK